MLVNNQYNIFISNQIEYNNIGKYASYSMYGDNIPLIPAEEQIVKAAISSGDTTYILTKKGNLYTCGYNQYGNCGAGTESAYELVGKRAENVKDFWITGWGGFYLTNDNKLYGCGYNANNQMGLSEKKNYTSFTFIRDNVKDLAEYNTGRTFIITTDDDLYACGVNSNGQIGDGTSNNITTFKKIGNLKIKKVFPYDLNTFILTTDDVLYGCGVNSGYELGVGNTTWYKSYTQISSNVKDFKFTKSNSNTSKYSGLLLQKDGRLFSWGHNGRGECGRGNWNPVQSKYNVASNVDRIFAVDNSYWYISNNNELYNSGSNFTTSGVNTFTKRAENVKDFKVCDGIFYYTDLDNRLYGAGSNNVYQQGDGTTTNVEAFTLKAENVKDFFVIKVATGYITPTNDLYAVGNSTVCGYIATGGLYTKIASKVKNMIIVPDNNINAGTLHNFAYSTLDNELYISGNNNRAQMAIPTIGNNNPYTKVVLD